MNKEEIEVLEYYRNNTKNQEEFLKSINFKYGDEKYIQKYKNHKNILNIIDKLQKENKKYKEVIDKAIKCVYYNTKYRNGADIYQFVDIESEILEPLQDILEQNDNSNNTYLKEFNDWLKEVE